MAHKHKQALFAISSLGLGHATRSLAIILDFLQQGWCITIISSGNALQLLQAELGEEPRINFGELQDYPPLERGTGRRFYLYLLVDLIATFRLIRKEHNFLRTIEADYDFIFSDGRYGFHSCNTPCAILTHQVAFMPPKFLRHLFWLTARLNILALKRFTIILIPDFPDRTINLSGLLSHCRHLENCRHHYIGILSSYKHLTVKQDIDYLFLISGYLLEHKRSFIGDLLKRARHLPGKKVFVLGQQGSAAQHQDLPASESIQLFDMVDGEMRQQLFNRAQRVISRAGYTTIMDLVEHNKKGVLIPTPNQTEQEYLADFLGDNNYFATTAQNGKIGLAEAIEKCETTLSFKAPWRSAQSLQKVRAALTPLQHQHFFSIVVPAHNEEKSLRDTLDCLLNQDYAAECFEIIVVENGSDDRTLEVAQHFSNNSTGRPKISVGVSPKGVSVAKNKGIAMTSASSDWIIFCDADTHLGPRFLRQLNLFLNASDNQFSVGTCSIAPRPAASALAGFWFRLYNHIHRYTATSYSLQIARTSVAGKVGFSAELEMSEDLLFLKECRRYGKFFFLKNNQVSTSTRRFESFGYLRLGLRWSIEALLPMRWKKNRRYDVIR